MGSNCCASRNKPVLPSKPFKQNSIMLLTDDQIWDKVNQIFLKFDQNNNDQLSDEEIKPYFLEENFTNLTIFTEWFNLLDTNDDNSIDKQELFFHFKELQYNSEELNTTENTLTNITFDEEDESDYEDLEHKRRSL